MDSEKSFPLIVVATGILIGFGGGTHPLSLGILLGFVGTWILVRPPLARIPRAAGLCWFLFLAWVALSLFWSPSEVAWKKDAHYLGLVLGSGTSPQPWVTLEALLPFLAGSAWFCLAFAHAPSDRHRRRGLFFLAATLVLLGSFAILGQNLGWRLPWADQVHVFSWFPNRNQTALVFACGSVLLLGLGLDLGTKRTRRDRAFGQKRRLTAAVGCFFGAALLLFAVFQTLSKGALLGWCGGVLFLFWAVGRGESGKTWWRVAPVAAMLFFGLFVFFGGEGRDRFMEFVSPADEVEGVEVRPDFRMQIYRDAGDMIRDQPVLGAGLGQFSHVFPQYRAQSAASVTVLHPESDWLWWTAELGAGGLLLLLAGAGFLAVRLRGWNADDRHRLTRCAALAALVPFFLHSFIDVGAHRIGTVALAILLYALALPPAGRMETGGGGSRNNRVPRPLLWRLAGGGLLLLGLAVAVLAWVQSPRLSHYAHTLDTPSARFPLEWEPYFRRAGRVHAEDPRAGREDFRRARFLQPHLVEIPLREGNFLLGANDHAGAFAAFRAALRRSSAPEETFRTILARTVRDPEHQRRLRALAEGEPDLLGLYWNFAPRPQLFSDAGIAPALLEDWPGLAETGRANVLQRFLEAGEGRKMQMLYERLPDAAQEALWPIQLRALAAEQEWESALKLFRERSEAPSMRKEELSEAQLLRLQAEMFSTPTIVTANRLLHGYLNRGAWSQVRRLTVEYPDLPDAAFWTGLAWEESGRGAEAVEMYVRWLGLSQ